MGAKFEYKHMEAILGMELRLEVLTDILIEKGIISEEEFNYRINAKKNEPDTKKVLEEIHIRNEFEERLGKCVKTGLTEEDEAWMKENLVKINSEKEVKETIDSIKLMYQAIDLFK